MNFPEDGIYTLAQHALAPRASLCYQPRAEDFDLVSIHSYMLRALNLYVNPSA
jgi:hypothetical protein